MLNYNYQTKTTLHSYYYSNYTTTSTTTTVLQLQQCQEVTQTLTMLLLLKLNLNYPPAELLVEEVNQQPSHQQHTFNLNCEWQMRYNKWERRKVQTSINRVDCSSQVFLLKHSITLPPDKQLYSKHSLTVCITPASKAISVFNEMHLVPISTN